MIYKCKNCGLEYKEYTEYCDCGNNKFVCISEVDNVDASNDLFSFDNVDLPNQNENISEENFDRQGFEHSTNVSNSISFLENRNFQNLLVFLIIVFTISLSSFVLYKAITVKSSVKPEKKQVAAVSVEIPSIDEYWDNSVEQVSTAVKNITNSVNTTNPSKNTKSTKNTNTKNNVKQNVKMVKTTAKNTNSVLSQIANQNNSNLSVTKKQPPKRQDSSSAKSKQNQQQNKVVNNSKTNLPKQETVSTNTNSAVEIDKFKVAVRQSLFSKFPVLQVQGQGSAIIAFSVAPNGKLLNRRFVQQSENQSLDDAVYHMLMQTPFVLSPPNSYSGQEYKIRIDVNNGQYEFSYQ